MSPETTQEGVVRRHDLLKINCSSFHSVLRYIREQTDMEKFILGQGVGMGEDASFRITRSLLHTCVHMSSECVFSTTTEN